MRLHTQTTELLSAVSIETGSPELLWMNHHAFIGNARSEKNVQHLRFFVVDYGGPESER